MKLRPSTEVARGPAGFAPEVVSSRAAARPFAGSTAASRPAPTRIFIRLIPSSVPSLKQLQAATPATEKRWNFESLDFISTLSAGGQCPAGTKPVYRAYNNGFARGVDSNHRISTDQAAIAQVEARGWISEGVVMCAPL